MEFMNTPPYFCLTAVDYLPCKRKFMLKSHKNRFADMSTAPNFFDRSVVNSDRPKSVFVGRDLHVYVLRSHKSDPRRRLLPLIAVQSAFV